MLNATRLKKINICEYLLYMWQIEDSLRALQFDIDRVNQLMISQFAIQDAGEQKIVYEWYESLIEMMRLENVQEKGHLQINKNIIIDLNEFHSLALKSGQVPEYNAKYIHVLPFINQLRMKSEPGLSDIELCFNFQYGVLLLNLKKSALNKDTIQAQIEISKFMVLLAKKYHAHQEGTLDLE